MDNTATVFDFRRKPFPIRFDSEFFWTNPRYDIICNNLLNGIRQHQGVMALTGEAGTGKTFLLRELMQQADRDGQADVQYIFFNYFSNLDFDDLLDLVCGELGLTPQDSNRLYKLKALSDHLNTSFSKGISTALLIDEAHNLDGDVVNHLVTLSRSGFKDGRSLQIVLSGLPLLGEKLSNWKTLHPSMAEVSENRLEPLSTTEVAAFIRHQLHVAGALDTDLFPEPVLESIARHARVPRLINTFCDSALRLAQAAGQTRISPAIIDEVADDILLSESNSHTPRISGIDPFIPAIPPKTKPRSPVIPSCVPVEVQVTDNTVPIVKPVSIEQSNTALPHSRGLAIQRPQRPQRPRRSRSRTWAALLLLIAIGTAGGYAVQQRYGFDDITTATKPALEAITAQWSSLSSKIPSFTQPPESQAPEIFENPPPLPDADSVAKSGLPEAPTAVSPPEPRTDTTPIAQTEPTTELADTAKVVKTPVPFEDISAVAKQALDLIETQGSAMASKILTSAQTLKPDTHLPPPTPAIVQNTPPQTEATGTSMTAASRVLQAVLSETGTDITLAPQPEPEEELADIASVVEASVSPEIDIYMRKGDKLVEIADLASARLFYEAAVKAGHTAAMIAVGKTYDPLVVKTLAPQGTHAEPLKAVQWYRKALRAGIPEAAEHLDDLQRWLADSPALGEAEGLALRILLQR